MINNKENNSKLYRLKNIYDILGSITKEKKPERLNSAKLPPNKLKFPSHKIIKIKKLNILNPKKNKYKNTEKQNMKYLYHLDIVKRRNNIKRERFNGNNNTNNINSSVRNLKNNKIKDAKVQTDKNKDYLKYIQNMNIQKDNNNNLSRAMIQYRIRKYHEKKRNLNDNIKTNIPIYQTFKNINLPYISHSHRDRKIEDYLDLSNNIGINKNKKINNKRYNCILNNLRIKLHGNIFITRKSKELESMNYFKNKMIVKNLKNIIKINSSISMDRSYKNTSKLSRYEQICSFSNQMIKDSLSERHRNKVFNNINN